MANITVHIAADNITQDMVKKEFRKLLFMFICGALHTENEQSAEEWLIIKGAQFRGIQEDEFKAELDEFWSIF
jgi:hypothetical protein